MLGVRCGVERRHRLVSAPYVQLARLNEVISRVQLEPGDSDMSGNDFDLRQQRDPGASATLLLYDEHSGDLPDQIWAKAKSNAAYGIGVSVGEDECACRSGQVITRSHLHLLQDLFRCCRPVVITTDELSEVLPQNCQGVGKRRIDTDKAQSGWFTASFRSPFSLIIHATDFCSYR